MSGVLLAAAVACRPSDATTRIGQASHERTGQDSAAHATGRPTVVFFGTSLTAGYGLAPDQAYPVLVAAMAERAGTPIEAVNAGSSGETSAGAVRRIGWILQRPADVVLIETGANDGLRGFPVDSTRASIQAVIDSARRLAPHAEILLAQMEALPNLGRAYTTAFHDMYPRLAASNHVTLLPFLLDGVAGHADLNQPDGVHPDIAGERIVAANVWKALAPIVADVSARRRS